MPKVYFKKKSCAFLLSHTKDRKPTFTVLFSNHQNSYHDTFLISASHPSLGFLFHSLLVMSNELGCQSYQNGTKICQLKSSNWILHILQIRKFSNFKKLVLHQTCSESFVFLLKLLFHLKTVIQYYNNR